jgi:hypothetical protein
MCAPKTTAYHSGEFHIQGLTIFLIEGAFSTSSIIDKDSRDTLAMTDDEHEENESSRDQDTESRAMPSPTEEELFGSDLETFLVALNRFSRLADKLEWPEGMPLDNDMNVMFQAFKIYWRQRIRQRKATEQYELNKLNEDNQRDSQPSDHDFKRFFRSRFRFGMDDEEEPEDGAIFIDPGEHQPHEKPSNDAAQQRESEFREKWE